MNRLLTMLQKDRSLKGYRLLILVVLLYAADKVKDIEARLTRLEVAVMGGSPRTVAPPMASRGLDNGQIASPQNAQPPAPSFPLN